MKDNSAKILAFKADQRKLAKGESLESKPTLRELIRKVLADKPMATRVVK